MAPGFPFAMSVVMLAACTAPPQQAAVAPAGPVLVVQDGIPFAADIRAGGPGKVLTAAGAVPSQGRTITVRRSDAVLAMDDGKRAKAVAEAACRQIGGRHNPRATGIYTPGAWQFAGACA